MCVCHFVLTMTIQESQTYREASECLRMMQPSERIDTVDLTVERAAGLSPLLIQTVNERAALFAGGAEGAMALSVF